MVDRLTTSIHDNNRQAIIALIFCGLIFLCVNGFCSTACMKEGADMAYVNFSDEAFVCLIPYTPGIA